MRFFCVLGDGLTDEYGEPVDGFVWQDGEDSPVVENPSLLAEWDGKSNTVTVIRGTMPATGIPFLGWPSMVIYF